jgi:hypothetical protein
MLMNSEPPREQIEWQSYAEFSIIKVRNKKAGNQESSGGFMTPFHIRRFLGVLFLLACALPLPAQKQYTLAYGFEPGHTYRYSDRADTRATQEMMGQEMKITSEAELITRLVVDTVLPSGDAVLVASVDSSRMHQNSPMGDTTYTLAMINGKRTRATLSPAGTVLSREVIDSITLPQRMGRIPLRDLLKFHRLPAQPVVMGEKWKKAVLDSTEIPGGHAVVNTDFEYTLAAEEVKQGEPCVRITYTGSLTTVGKGTRMGMDIFYEGTGKVTGTLFFGLKSGMLVNDDATTESESTIAVTGQQTMTIPSTQTVHAVRTLLAAH